MDHLLISCVFARQFWFNFLRRAKLQELSPQSDADSFLEWWRKANEFSLGLVRKSLNSPTILGVWTLWKHRNRCVFDGAAPCSAACLAQADEERRMWELGRAKGISFLMAQLPADQGFL
jgi:hypothetical protein